MLACFIAKNLCARQDVGRCLPRSEILTAQNSILLEFIFPQLLWRRVLMHVVHVKTAKYYTGKGILHGSKKKERAPSHWRQHCRPSLPSYKVKIERLHK